MFPYLDRTGFLRRTRMPTAEINQLEEDSPGYVEMCLAQQSSYINTRLRKRYGSGVSTGNSLPLGQAMGTVLSAGTDPPGVTVAGRPTLGSIRLRVEITTGGALGVALFRISYDGGFSWAASGVTTAAGYRGLYGILISFAAGTYSADNVYVVDSPVPEVVLRWLVVLVTADLYDKRGADPQDAALVRLKESLDRTYDEIKEAADGKDGLLDIPTNEDADSAVTTGFVLGYAEQSPYTWTDVEASAGSFEDSQRNGRDF